MFKIYLQDDDNNGYSGAPWSGGLIYGFMLVETMLKVNDHFLSLFRACTVRSSMWLELNIG